MIFGRKRVESADSEQGSIINKETEGLSQGQIVRKKFLQHNAAMIAIFVLSSIVIFVFSALKQKIGPWTYPGWWRYGIEDLSDLTTGCKDGLVGCPTASLRPQWLGGAGIGLGEHPFGQDDIGRDYFALVMRGAQRSLMVTVIIGARTANLLVGDDGLVAAGVEVIYCTDDGSAGVQGRVTDALLPLLKSDSRVYTCGPTPMMKAVGELSEAHGVDCQVSLETFMPCGVGICVGCVVKMRDGVFSRTCTDGPVYPGCEVAW